MSVVCVRLPCVRVALSCVLGRCLWLRLCPVFARVARLFSPWCRIPEKCGGTRACRRPLAAVRCQACPPLSGGHVRRREWQYDTRTQRGGWWSVDVGGWRTAFTTNQRRRGGRCDQARRGRAASPATAGRRRSGGRSGRCAHAAACSRQRHLDSPPSLPTTTGTQKSLHMRANRQASQRLVTSPYLRSASDFCLNRPPPLRSEPGLRRKKVPPQAPTTSLVAQKIEHRDQISPTTARTHQNATAPGQRAATQDQNRRR